MRTFIRSFFSQTDAPDFIPFSTAHFIWVAVLIILILGLFWGRTYIRHHRFLRFGIRYGLVLVLLLNELALNIWYVVWGEWTVSRSLPLELCTISLLLSIVMLCNRSRMLYSILYFAGICGALQAIVTPSLDYGFPHFRFYEFFIAHIAIILSPLYMTWVEQYRPSWRSIGWTMLYLNVLALLVGIVNLALGSNYMFLQHKPNTPSVLDMFGPYPYYLLAEEGIALVMFIVMYTLFFFIPDKLKKNSKGRDIESVAHN